MKFPLAILAATVINAPAMAQQPAGKMHHPQDQRCRIVGELDRDRDRDRWNDRRTDRDTKYHAQKACPPQPGVPYPQATRAGDPNPYATRAGDPNPYATRAGDPNPYATRAGTPKR